MGKLRHAAQALVCNIKHTKKRVYVYLKRLERS